MSRPTLGSSKTVRLNMLLAADELEAIDIWQHENRIASRSEAVRRLRRIGMKVKGPAAIAVAPSHDSNIPGKE